MGKGARAAARIARLEALRAEQWRATRRRRRIWIVTVGTAALIAGAVASWVAVTTSKPTVALTGLVSYANLARTHVTSSVTYAQTPPAGGEHAEAWQNCGIYTQPVANENAVHSLEHGSIWITYQPGLPADQLATLQHDVSNQPYGLLSPYPGLPTPIVATVWGVQLRLQTAADPRLNAFIAKYADARHAPEPRGECTGGIGTPQR